MHIHNFYFAGAILDGHKIDPYKHGHTHIQEHTHTYICILTLPEPFSPVIKLRYGPNETKTPQMLVF